MKDRHHNGIFPLPQFPNYRNVRGKEYAAEQSQHIAQLHREAARHAGQHDPAHAQHRRQQIPQLRLLTADKPVNERHEHAVDRGEKCAFSGHGKRYADRLDPVSQKQACADHGAAAQKRAGYAAQPPPKNQSQYGKCCRKTQCNEKIRTDILRGGFYHDQRAAPDRTDQQQRRTRTKSDPVFSPRPLNEVLHRGPP